MLSGLGVQGMQAEARPLQHALQLLNNKVATGSQAAVHCQEVQLRRQLETLTGLTLCHFTPDMSRCIAQPHLTIQMYPH